MRKIIVIFAILSLLLAFWATPVYANGIPSLPHAFYGNVTINGDAAADDTQVSATVDNGTVIPTQNPVTTSGGNYGINNPRLLVQGDITPGANITFYVNGYEATPSQAASFESGGGPDRIDLSVTIAAPPAGGGGGGGGGAPSPDTTPPKISACALCPSLAVTETTADICWITDEPSTSQVEYWASPGMLSPLDETMVTEHHVKLTDLTPDTTYHYKTMSRDAAGNPAVSDVLSFTTAGKAPAAIFTVSDLSISPDEVNIGDEVTITLLVTNTGTDTGSYKVTLKLNGVVEATKEVVLDAGASQEVTFTTAKDVAGSYSVDVNELSGSFTAKEKPTPPAPPAPPAPPPEVKPPVNWPLIGGIMGGCVAVGLLILFWARRRTY